MSCADDVPDADFAFIDRPPDRLPVRQQPYFPSSSSRQDGLLMNGPLLEDAADIFPSNAGHCSEVALRNLLPQDNTPAVRARIVTVRTSRCKLRGS